MKDQFHTLAGPSSGEFKDRGSKFLAFAYPVRTEEEALERVEALRKEHFKARHHCFAWRLGLDGQRFRANDDGEPCLTVDQLRTKLAEGATLEQVIDELALAESAAVPPIELIAPVAVPA